jgi:spermidine synthase
LAVGWFFRIKAERRMSHIFLDTRDGRLALYLNGELQFDQRDEHLYHEPLALVPTALARDRSPGRPLRVLILGGGDGLALREVLRFPEVAECHVLDRDPEVLRLGRGALEDLNRHAFRDPRARSHALDARLFLKRARGFDVLICDLTYPRDVAGASLFSVTSFRRMRTALRPEGILAMNAVSPELTPQAFGCIGQTLGAAGLWAVPYAFVLPSFASEGYGRWGFCFASARPIPDVEFRRLTLPVGARLTAHDFLAGTRFPATVINALDAAPNRKDELLAYLSSDSPLRWEGPLRPFRFTPEGRSPSAASRPMPERTAAQGFARWLRQADGRRSLGELLACLPVAQRGHTREVLLEWSHHLEALLRSVDLRLFLDELLRRARELPQAWRQELRALKDRLRDGGPSAEELLHLTHRVLAILLLVLVLANLFFPDNLYAKGFSSSSVHGGSGSGASPFYGFSFSNPTARYSPFRSRSTYAGGRFYSYGSPTSPSWVYDSQGREYPALRFAFTDTRGGQRPMASLLALTKDLQLLETSGIAYTAAVPGYRFLLDPGRLRVLDREGVEVVALLPDARLEDEVKQQLRAQGPLIEKAITDHQRWLDWVRWASTTAGGQQAASELAALEAIRQAVASAQAVWEGVSPRPAPAGGGTSVFPGVYLEPPGPDPVRRSVVLISPDGTARPRSVAPPPALTSEDRFLFWVLNRWLTEGRDPSLADPIARWIETHGEALGVRPARPTTAGQPS